MQVTPGDKHPVLPMKSVMELEATVGAGHGHQHQPNDHCAGINPANLTIGETVNCTTTIDDPDLETTTETVIWRNLRTCSAIGLAAASSWISPRPCHQRKSLVVTVQTPLVEVTPAPAHCSEPSTCHHELNPFSADGCHWRHSLQPQPAILRVNTS